MAIPSGLGPEYRGFESLRPDKSGDQDLKVGPRNKCSGRRTETPAKLTYLGVGGVRTMGKTLIVGFGLTDVPGSTFTFWERQLTEEAKRGLCSG